MNNKRKYTLNEMMNNWTKIDDDLLAVKALDKKFVSDAIDKVRSKVLKLSKDLIIESDKVTRLHNIINGQNRY